MGDIPGNLGAAKAYAAEAKVHQANARVARAQGRAARGQAYGQAARMEAENEVAGRQAVQNLERLHEQKTQARGAARAARGAGGFTAAGSGSKTEISVLQAFEQQAQDMAQSRALQDVSARFGAAMARKSGDLAEMGANINADYEGSKAELSKIKQRGAYTAAAWEATTAIIGGYLGATKLAQTEAFGGNKAKGAFAGAMIGSSVGQWWNKNIPGSVESAQSGMTDFQKGGQQFVASYIGNKIDSWLK